MDNPYDERQRDWLDRLQARYRMVVNGICMAALRPDGRIDEADCKGSLGFRHAIARRHLRLIANGDNKILANKEFGSFDVWPDKYEALQATSIGRFSAGKWSCQKHDERFGGIDARRIDLGNSENLFKVVYRVVLRQCHLTFARWHAFFVETKSDEDWELFVSGVATPRGLQLEAGAKAQGISASMSEAGWPLAMASSVALR